MRIPVLIVLVLMGASSGGAEAFDGPLQLRNQFPLFAGMGAPFFESAEARNTVALSLHHSSTYMTEGSFRWGIAMDLEVTELDIRLKKRLGDRSEVGLDVPVIRPSGGFFDRPLDAWHDLLGVGDYGRNKRPHNAYLYEITYNGAPLVVGENDRTAFGDVRLSFKRGISSGAAPISVLSMSNCRRGTPTPATGMAVSMRQQPS